MRFQFCGGLNIPEWFLSQFSLLSKLSSIKIRKIVSGFIKAYLDKENRAELVKWSFIVDGRSIGGTQVT